MALSNISLTAGMRANLFNMQTTARLMDQTQTRLSSGKRVNTALDDPINFFAAQGHTNRASDLNLRKDGMGEAIQTIKAADAGMKGITDLLAQAKSLITAARTTTLTADANALENQYNSLLTQLDNLADDAGYKGINLLDGNNITIEFNENSGSAGHSLTVTGFTADASTFAMTAAAANSWLTGSNLNAAETSIDNAISTLRTKAQTLSNNLSIITTRQDFTQNMIDTLQKGADDLTLADMNEEGANMLMLQTRQQLATTALSLASQAAQSVLRLF